MQEQSLIQMIQSSFLHIKNDNTISLIEAYYHDNFATKSLEEYSLNGRKSDKFLSEASEFVKTNINNQNRFIEPFNSWNDIPNWYIKMFSECPFGVLSSKKINFYLPKFMTLFLEESRANKGHHTDCKGFENWIDYLLPYQNNVKIEDRSFSELNDIQKSLIAVFLCYDDCNNIFDFDSEYCSSFNNYWLKYLYIFKDLNHNFFK